MKTFVTPDTRWLHGVENNTEYFLGRPERTMRLHFSEELCFGIKQFLSTVTNESDRLVKTMWAFGDGVPVPLTDPKVRALVHMLKRFCDYLSREREYNADVRASDTHEIVELRMENEVLMKANKSLRQKLDRQPETHDRKEAK